MAEDIKRRWRVTLVLEQGTGEYSMSTVASTELRITEQLPARDIGKLVESHVITLTETARLTAPKPSGEVNAESTI